MFCFFVLFACACAFARGQQTITILSPTKGLIWKSGLKATVTWSSVGLPDDAPIGVEVWDARAFSLFDVQLLDRDDNKLAEFETTNSGSLELFVPVVEQNDESLFVVVYSLTDKNVAGKSEQFTVETLDHSLTVYEPQDLNVLVTGEPVTVKWVSTNIPADAELRVELRQKKSLAGRFLSFEDDVIVQVAANSAPNSGEFTWAVPLDLDVDSAYHFVVVWPLSGLRANSHSNSVRLGPKRLSVTQPLASVPWIGVATAKTVAWDSVGIEPAGSVMYGVQVYRQLDDDSEVAVGDVVQAMPPRTYVTLPAELDTEPGVYYARVFVLDQPSLAANSERVAFQPGYVPGMYMGEENALGAADSAATLRVCFGAPFTFIGVVFLSIFVRA